MNADGSKRRQLGVVGALWRYPVKSMLGETVAAAEITHRGVAGDRVWAVRECAYGGLVSARTWPAMLRLRASWERDAAAGTDLGDRGFQQTRHVEIGLPDGSSIRADGLAAPRVLSAFLQREVRLEQVRTAPITPEEREAIMRGDLIPPARDYFDEDVIHLIATGTLAHMRELSGGGSDFDARRFRANVIVDTGDDAKGFVEDAWLNGVIEIGKDVRITGMRPALRCAITTHPQDNLPHDPIILRTAWQFHQAYAGIFAAVEAEGTIRVGDPVYLTG